MKTVLFTDLDDCFLATKRKFPPNTPLSTAAFDAMSEPRSFSSPKQKAMLNLFVHTGAEIIPVTGRSREVFGRVSLAELKQSWKVVSHGAFILNKDDSPNEQWLERQAREHNLRQWADDIGRLNTEISTLISTSNFPARSYVVDEQDIRCYLCVKCEEGTGYSDVFTPVLQLVSASRLEFRIHVNGRNLALLPPYTDKSTAVKFIQEQYFSSDDLFIGVGDSLSDLPFMQSTDFSIAPTNSQIFSIFLEKN